MYIHPDEILVLLCNDQCLYKMIAQSSGALCHQGKSTSFPEVFIMFNDEKNLEGKMTSSVHPHVSYYDLVILIAESRGHEQVEFHNRNRGATTHIARSPGRPQVDTELCKIFPSSIDSTPISQFCNSSHLLATTVTCTIH